jgi:hypothetical protein
MPVCRTHSFWILSFTCSLHPNDGKPCGHTLDSPKLNPGVQVADDLNNLHSVWFSSSCYQHWHGHGIGKKWTLSRASTQWSLPVACSCGLVSQPHAHLAWIPSKPPTWQQQIHCCYATNQIWHCIRTICWLSRTVLSHCIYSFPVLSTWQRNYPSQFGCLLLIHLLIYCTMPSYPTTIYQLLTQFSVYSQFLICHWWYLWFWKSACRFCPRKAP